MGKDAVAAAKAVDYVGAGTIEFLADNNSTEQCFVRSHMIQNFTMEHKEKLIYDPRNPSNVVIIDTLPTSVARFILNKIHKSNI